MKRINNSIGTRIGVNKEGVVEMMKWEMVVFIRMLIDKVMGLDMWEITSMGRMIGIMKVGMGGNEGRWKW
jgi:hypothetical protein